MDILNIHCRTSCCCTITTSLCLFKAEHVNYSHVSVEYSHNASLYSQRNKSSVRFVCLSGFELHSRWVPLI